MGGDSGQITADWIHRRVTGVIGDNVPHDWMVPPQHTILATLRAFIHAIEMNTPFTNYRAGWMSRRRGSRCLLPFGRTRWGSVNVSSFARVLKKDRQLRSRLED